MKELVRSTKNDFILNDKLGILFKIILLFSWPFFGMFYLSQII